MNGWALVPRDIKESLLAKEWRLRRDKHITNAAKVDTLSVELIKSIGFHITYPKQYNEHSLQIEQSIKKIQEYHKGKQI